MKHKKLLIFLLVSNICMAAKPTILSDTTEYNVPKPLLKNQYSDTIDCQATAYPYTEKVNEMFAVHGQAAYYIGDVTLQNETFDIDTYMCVNNICNHRKTSVNVYPYVVFGDSWTLTEGDLLITSPGKYEEDAIIQMTSRNTAQSCVNINTNYVTVK